MLLGLGATPILAADPGDDLLVSGGQQALDLVDELRVGADEHARQLEAWQTIQRSHAIANGLFVAAVNRVGAEGELTFWGHSFCAGPQGELIAELGEDADRVEVVTCDRQRTRDVRQWWPFFRDRRVDQYGDLTRRWGRS